MKASGLFVFSGTVMLVLACTRTPGTQTPSPSPAPAQPSTAQAPAANAPPAGRRPPPSRDSAAKLRATRVQEVLASIAGRENEPAERVFKNVQVLKGITARELVTKMDEEFGRALSWSCTNCHRVNQNDYATDTIKDKKRARAMIEMTKLINEQELPKLYPKDTPKVSCATCHRGYNEPLGPEYLIPIPGAPGGPPPPRPRPPGH